MAYSPFKIIIQYDTVLKSRGLRKKLTVKFKFSALMLLFRQDFGWSS